MGRVAFDDDYVEYSDSRNAPLLADGDFGDLDVDETELTTFQATVLMMKGFVGIGWMSIAYGFGKARWQSLLSAEWALKHRVRVGNVKEPYAKEQWKRREMALQ